MGRKKGFLLVGLVLILGSCSTEPVGNEPPIKDLLIDQSCFPQGWSVYVVGAIPSEEKQERRAEDAIGMWLEPSSPDLTQAGYEVYRYRSARAARSAFDKWVRREFNSNSVASITVWEVPPEMPYKSSVADQSRFGCHISGITGTRICQFMGQYDEFVILFYAGHDGQHMTYTDLERILKAIDGRMISVKN